MDALRRGISVGVVALALGGLLAGCSDDGDGGGGGAALRLFFGTNGDGNCQSIVVDVRLDVAHAVLARNDDDSFDCGLNALLDSSGCDVAVSELEDGDRLRVTINGCTVPAVTNLFQCRFTESDISELTSVTSAQCACQTQGCDTTPPVCISEDIDPGSCEDCDNGQDDDDNGLVDCFDPNCEHSPLCADGTSTTTIEVTTTVEGPTTTQEPVTTTTLDGGSECTITFRLADAVTVGSLQWQADYGDAPGEIPGQGQFASCTNLASGAIAAFTDDDAQSKLDYGVISVDGIDGPADLLRCDFEATSVPSVQDFDITVSEASDPDLVPLVPLPDVIVSNIDCGSLTTTTVDGETTTTLGDTTTTLDETTTTTLGVTTTTVIVDGDTFDVLFRLNSASAAIGALQVTANYATATGDFEGSGAAVSCTNLVSGALFAPNDNDGTRKLTLGLIALQAFSAPADLVRCTFAGSSEDPPVPADFQITIDDATDADGAGVTASVGVTVSPAP